MLKLLTRVVPKPNRSLSYSLTHSSKSKNELHPAIENHLRTTKTLKKESAKFEPFTINSIFSRGIFDIAKLNFVHSEAERQHLEKKNFYFFKTAGFLFYILIMDVVFSLGIRKNIKKKWEQLTGDDDSYKNQNVHKSKKNEKSSQTEEKKEEKEIHYDTHGNEIKSKYYVKNTGVKFDDVRGIGDERGELTDVVDFMRSPERYNSLGARLPKGILLSGPPGVGKTLLAKAVANEAGVPFFHIDGSSIEGPWVGTGVRKLEEIFAAAKQHSPSIVFIDEIDAIGGKRTTSDKYPHARSTINTLLSMMDGFDKDDPVVVMGSTNMPGSLDEALMRSGRFDLKIDIPKPLRHQREQILQFYLGKLQTTVDINVEELARVTGGMVPADFKNLASTAGRIAVAKGNLAVTQKELIEAKDQITMGVGRRSELKHLSKVTTENTAWHEAGHALCMYLCNKKSLRSKINMPEALGIHKITIIPRGGSGGHTAWLQADGEFFQQDTYSYLMAALGGYVGEQMYDTNVTTGPSGDFGQVTNVAKELVLKDFLENDKLGKFYSDEQKDVYKNFSDAEKEVIDKKIVELTRRAFKDCQKLLEENRGAMKAIAEALVKYDQITFEEMVEIVDKQNPTAGEYLRVEENPELNKKRIIKPKGVEPDQIPAHVIKENLENIRGNATRSGSPGAN